MTPTSSVRRQRGSVTLMFLFSMTSIMLSLLAAIDIMRYNLVQSRLQSALDAAVLAAGRNLGNLGDSPSQSSQQAWRQAVCWVVVRSPILRKDPPCPTAPPTSSFIAGGSPR